MENIEGPYQDRKSKAREELCSHTVRVPLQIFEELEDMDLSVQEIESVLRNCRLNVNYAIRLGVAIRDEKKRDQFHTGKGLHCPRL